MTSPGPARADVPCSARLGFDDTHGEFGGERGIRTPDTRKGMADFESAAFNRALPALRVAPSESDR